MIIAGDEQGKIRAWDVLTGKERRFTSEGSASSVQHNKAVLWIEAREKESGRVVTAGADGIVKIWQCRSMEEA